MAFSSKELMVAAYPSPSIDIQACGQVTAGCGQATAPGSCAITLAMEAGELGGLPALLQQLHSTLGQPAA